MEFSEQTRFTGMRCPKARFSRSALGNQLWAASSALAFCEQFIGQLRLLEHDQTMRDSGDVCGARNTQFDQEFLGLFRREMVSAYDWRDRIGDFCVADYLVEHYTVHVGEIFYTIQPPLTPHELMPSQAALTTARECSPPQRQREPWPPS